MNISYEQARELIQDGDIISILRLKTNATIMSNFISWFTQSEIYHTVIAVWMTSDNGEKRLFVVEADPANRLLVPLSVFQKNGFHVLAKPDYVDFKKISSELVGNVGIAKYSITKAVNSGIRQYLKLPKISNTGEICSELVAKMWKLGGLPIEDTLLDPAELERILTTNFKVQYRCKVG